MTDTRLQTQIFFEIAMSTGNPFPGRFADCYRCGTDIHEGTWPEERKACRATAPSVVKDAARRSTPSGIGVAIRGGIDTSVFSRRYERRPFDTDS